MDNYKSDNYTRTNHNATSDDEAPQQYDISIIRDEVKKLFDRKGRDNMNITIDELNEWRNNKLEENIIDKIYDTFYKELERMDRRARRFAESMLKHYKNYTLGDILKKALKLNKTKYQYSDSEFNEFKRILEKKLLGTGNEGKLIRPRTKIGLALLNEQVIDHNVKKVSNLSAREIKTLEEITKLHAATKILHSQVIIQSISYRDCAPEALIGRLYDVNNMIENPTNHVHPIIAALFLPKIQVLDEQILFANLSNIVVSRHAGIPLKTKPDYELYNAISNDPNDAVCAIDNPLVDLFNRCVLQKDIWNAVLHLRNGRYYKHHMENFLIALDKCRINMYDTPDLIYTKDEGAILRKILSAFSFRPTMISTLPVGDIIVNNNPYVRQPFYSNVITIPMLILRIPIVSTATGGAPQIALEDALNQSHWYLEKNAIVPKHQSVINSHGVLFFYVNRRFQAINLGPQQAFNFGRLPLTVSGFERVNKQEITVNPVITIMQDNYNLRSAVIVDTVKNQFSSQDLIVGTSTAIMKHVDMSRSVYQNHYWLYDPLGAGIFKSSSTYNNSPITRLRDHRPLDSITESFYERVQTRGTIIMYEKDTSGSSNNPFFSTTYPC